MAWGSRHTADKLLGGNIEGMVVRQARARRAPGAHGGSFQVEMPLTKTVGPRDKQPLWDPEKAEVM